MAGPYDEWRNTYGVPGPQDPNRPHGIWATEAPRWEELLRGSDVTAIKTNPLVQALGQYLSKPSTGIGEVTRVSPIDGRPVPPEPGMLDRLPPTVQEGIGGLGLLANFLAPGVKLPPVAPKPTGIRAYHGSPHDFDRFDISKIGTGEGAQAYGHGLYFAEKEGVAKGYRDRLASQPLDQINDAIKAASVFSGEKLDAIKMRDWLVREKFPQEKITPEVVELSIRAARGNMPDGTVTNDALQAYRLLERAVGNKGRMYEVNINADPERFLDWDKPIREQSEHVRKALGVAVSDEAALRARLAEIDTQLSDAMGKVNASDFDDFFAPRPKLDALAREANDIRAAMSAGVPKGHPLHGLRRSVIEDMSGQEIARPYSKYRGRGDDAVAASQALREAGIPGIRYLDGGSRAAGVGSSNYVVFDDKLIEILRKYGLLPPAAAAGAALMEQQEPPL